MNDETLPSHPSVPSSNVSKLILTAKQQEAQSFLRQGQRHTLLVGGSRSGKTTLLVHEIASRALDAENSRHAILRLHANAARASIALDTLPKVFRVAWPQEVLKHRRTEGYFSLRNGSEIWIGGLDDAERVEKILGREFATIFFNECSQIPYASVMIALTRLAQVAEGLRQAAFYDLNPVGKGHWSNILFGDKRDPVSRQLIEDPGNYVRMFLNPADNADNLTKDYLDSLARLPERQRKRFYEGVYIDELDGALFSYEIIARARVDELPAPRRRRIVVAVDPSGASGSDDQRADEIGIIVAAKGDDGHAYVLADRSLRDAPAAWGRAAVHALHEFDADCIVAEENFGGEMVRFVIRAADPNVKVHVISASRGKVVRAEPVSALYEQSLVHHVGRFAVLEDQLCAFTTAGYRGEGSPDHADALVFAIGELLLHERAAILEFYRRQVEDRIAAVAQKPQRDRLGSPSMPASAPEKEREAATMVRLKAPQPISCVHGPFGTYYMADGEHTILVPATESNALIAQGFVVIGDQ
ncbi:MAG TPA: phage terminase large subunit [Xanthobacteraceae bacterium]|nr:phage terminase large subunit [Xanthobacteraceae bacterium]